MVPPTVREWVTELPESPLWATALEVELASPDSPPVALVSTEPLSPPEAWSVEETEPPLWDHPALEEPWVELSEVASPPPPDEPSAEPSPPEPLWALVVGVALADPVEPESPPVVVEVVAAEPEEAEPLVLTVELAEPLDPLAPEAPEVAVLVALTAPESPELPE